MAYGNEIDTYKEYAAQRRKNRKYDIFEITKALEGITNYIEESITKGRPATISGMILASGCNKDFYYRLKNGDFDYIAVEYIIENNITETDLTTSADGLQWYIDKSTDNKIMLSPFSDVIEKCLLLIEDSLQVTTLTNKSMAITTGAIFNLKAVFNYNDKPEAEARTVNNTLIVNTDAKQAAEAMKLLCKNTEE